jgi:hypothetical protein
MPQTETMHENHVVALTHALEPGSLLILSGHAQANMAAFDGL